MNYAQQIKHPNWQRKRLEVLELHNFSCEQCGSKEEELNIHHPFYRKGAMIWQYNDNELMCLCIKCHADEHRLDELIKKHISVFNLEQKLNLLKYMESVDGVTSNRGFLTYIRKSRLLI